MGEADNTTLVLRGEDESSAADPAPPGSGSSDQSLLYTEAQRLLQFKQQNIQRQSQTPCPECTELVSVDAKRCPHCASDIHVHTGEARSSLEKLHEVMDELAGIHAHVLARHKERLAKTSIGDRLRGLAGDPQLRRDVPVLGPAFAALLVVLVGLRLIAPGLVFWTLACAASVAVYMWLRRSSYRRWMTVDAYGSLLGLAVAVVLASAVFRPMPFWPESLDAIVTVQASAANVREEPTTQSDVLTVAESGDRLRVLDHEGSWYQVRTNSGDEGWVYDELVH